MAKADGLRQARLAPCREPSPATSVRFPMRVCNIVNLLILFVLCSVHKYSVCWVLTKYMRSTPCTASDGTYARCDFLFFCPLRSMQRIQASRFSKESQQNLIGKGSCSAKQTNRLRISAEVISIHTDRFLAYYARGSQGLTMILKRIKLRPESS